MQNVLKAMLDIWRASGGKGIKIFSMGLQKIKQGPSSGWHLQGDRSQLQVKEIEDVAYELHPFSLLLPFSSFFPPHSSLFPPPSSVLPLPFGFGVMYPLDSNWHVCHSCVTLEEFFTTLSLSLLICKMKMMITVTYLLESFWQLRAITGHL